ncbi:MAG: conjugal transfer protein TraG N-terminal domain-containing protein [bacterium]
MGNIMITSYGNGQLMLKILNAIAGMMSDSNYVVMVMLILGLATTLGIIGYHKDMAAVGISAHSTWIIKGFTTLAIFWMLTGAHVNVFVYDPLNAFSGVADNVPICIALPLNFENQISSEMATLAGDYFAPNGYASEFLYDNPSAGAGFYNPGMASPLLAIETAMRANSTDMYFSETMNDFGANCLVPAMSIGVVNPNDLQTSSDIEDLLTADMANMPSGWTGTFYTSSNPGGTTYTCAVDWDNYIVPEINNMVNPSANGRYNNQFQNSFNANTGSTQNELADTELLGNATSYMFNFSITGQQALAQAALMNSIGGGISQAAAQTGTSGAAQSYAVTQAFSEMMNSWTTSAITGPRILPIMHMVLLCLVIAVLPFIFALAVVPTMTGKYMKMVFELLLWFALWAPIASVINFLVNSYMASKVFINVNNPNSYTAGFNLANYDFISNHLHEYIAITGGLMWTVPLFSFMLVSGSAIAMTSVAGAIGGTAHGLSSNAGTHVGSQNGLGAIEGAAGRQEGWQKEQEQGINPISADEKIAGMGGLDNLANASGTANAIRAESYAGYTKGVASNKLQAVASGVTTAGQAQQLGNFKGEQALSGMAGANTAARELGFSSTQQYLNATATAAGINSGAQGLANMQHPNTFESRALMNESNKLASAMQYQTFMTETGMLPKNFSSLAPQQKLEALMSADKNLTGNYSGVNLNAAQAQKLGLPAAGTYDFHMNKQGQMVAISGRGSQSFTGVLNTASGKFVGTETGEIGGKPIYTSANRGGNLSTDHINKAVNDDSATNKSGVFFENPNYAAQQSIMRAGSFMGWYSQFAPGTYSGAVNKDQFAQGAMINQAVSTISSYAGNSNSITLGVEAQNKFIASAGFNFLGTGAKDQLTVSAKAVANTTMSVDALKTSATEQLTNLSQKFDSGQISHAEYVRDVDNTVAAYTALIKAGAAPSLTNAVNGDVNAYDNIVNNKNRGVMPNGKSFMGDNGNKDSM